MGLGSRFIEFVHFAKDRKKLWLLPALILFLLLGALIVFIQTSPLSPFLYVLF